MRHIFAICSLLLTMHAFSQPVPAGVRATPRPDYAPATVGEAIQRIKAERHASVIRDETPSDAFIIPVAGNAPGSGGTYFRSDVTLVNMGNAQRIGIGWLAAGENNCASPLRYFTLNAASGADFEDFVGSFLGKTGLGAVLIVGVDANGSSDTNAKIDGVSRIWTPQPGSAGTVSQNFAAVSLTDSLGTLVGNLLGLKQNVQYRTNVGVVNLELTAKTWDFHSLATGVITTVTVQPCSMTLTSAAAGSGNPVTGSLSFGVQSRDATAWWTGFGSSSDNVTGDGWVSRVIQ